ncbi:SGNH/GDSL hydrolase family protein [Polaribacter sp.]|uniref:SGNH/GDSL hydrolase family protein n=1 Tax=Polaribacter sp. TaxID=1920175 RepID=UPI003F6BF4EA
MLKINRLSILVSCIFFSFYSFTQNKSKVNLTFFGSSVCKGYGAKNDQGYAWMFYNSNVIDTLKYKYYNVSTNGDNTIKLEKFDRLSKKLYPTKPKIVVIGLSLGNEGLRKQVDQNGREQVLEQFRSRLLRLSDSLYNQGIKPVIVNCYAHSLFDENHYRITKRMNEIINTWKYPSINVLGAIDNYEGKWVDGFVNDPWHPNNLGHKEMSYTIVPSLFDALLAGKKTPIYDYNPSYITLKNKKSEQAPLLLDLKNNTVHSFTLSFRFKKMEDGSIAGFVQGNKQNSISIKGFNLKYKTISVLFDRYKDKWNHLVLSHSFANKKSILYLNGVNIGEVEERLSPSKFYFGGTSKSIELKDLSFHRSSINKDEVINLFNKKIIQSSLDFFASLTKLTQDKKISNEAQSLLVLNIEKSQELILNNLEY